MRHYRASLIAKFFISEPLYRIDPTKIFPHTNITNMASHIQEEHKPDGAAFDQFFDSIGSKAENLTLNGGGKAATNSAAPSAETQEDEPKVVDEIESLCMNCRENVCTLPKRPQDVQY